MLQDSWLDNLGQVSTLSRRGILASLLPLSASLQDSLCFLYVPIPPEDFGFTHVRLTVLMDRPHGACLVPSATHL